MRAAGDQPRHRAEPGTGAAIRKIYQPDAVRDAGLDDLIARLREVHSDKSPAPGEPGGGPDNGPSPGMPRH